MINSNSNLITSTQTIEHQSWQNIAKGDIPLFYAYRITSRLYFHLPVIFPFFFSVDMGIFLTEVLLASYGLATMLESTISISSFLLGYLRQKFVIAIGEIFKAIGLILIIYGTTVSGTNIWTPIVGQILGGIGFSIAISTDTALIRSITNSAPEGQFSKIQAQTQSYIFVATFAAGTIGSILFDYEAHWPFYCSIFMNIIAIISILLIKNDKKPEYKNNDVLQETKKLLLEPDVEFWINFYALSRAFTLAPFVGYIPFFFTMLQVDPYLFGPVLGLFSIAAFFSARYSNNLLSSLGFKVSMLILTGSMLSSMLLFAFFDIFNSYFLVGLVAISLLGIGAGGVRPLSTSNLNLTKFNPQQRTMVFSLMERRFGILNALMLLCGSWFLINLGFQSLMLAFALLYVSLLILLMTSLFLRQKGGLQKSSR